MFSLTRLQRYGISVAGVVLTAVLRLALDPILGEDLPLFLFVFPIILAGWCGGLWPGIVATVLSLLLGDYLFIVPAGSLFNYENQLNLTRAVALAFTGTGFSILFHRAQKAIKAHLECLERFRLLVEGARDYAIFTLDPSGRVACWNTGAERIEGFLQADVIGQDFSMFYTPEDVEHGKPRSHLQIAVAEGRCEEEGWQTRKDGSRFWASGVMTPLRDDQGQLCGFAVMVRDMTQHRLADEGLRESQRFAQIINVSTSMICIYDLRQRKNVFVNRSIASALGYASMQSLQDVEFIASVMHPGDRQSFFDHLSRVAGLRDEETADIEYRMRHSCGAWRWFHSRDKVFSRSDDGTVREVIGTATDITDRKNVENRTRFVDELNQALLPLGDPAEIMAVTVRMLGRYLDVDRCGYAEIERDKDQFVVMGDYTRDGTPSIVGEYRLSEFGDNERQVLQGNCPYVVDDIEAEAPAGADLSLYRRGQIRALVCVPLTKHGNFVARIAVHQNTPRHWSSDEIELITTVASRCWESVERARALRNLKESDERYRAFITNSSEAIWRFELEQPIPLAMPEADQLELLYQSAYLAECNDAMARMYGYDKADQIMGARIGDLLVKSDPQNVAFLLAFRRAGYRLTDVETREVDRYGNTKYFLNNLIGIQENDVIARGWGTQRDITNQKQAEEALRVSEERYRLLTELSPDGVVIADAEGKIHFANPSIVQMLGATAKGLDGRNLFDFVPTDLQSYCRDCLKTVMTNGKAATQVDARFQSEDSRTFPVEVSAVHFEWKGQPFAQIVIHDLSGRKEAEAERKRLSEDIEAERNRLTQILQQMPIGVAIAEAPSGRMLFHNLEAVRLLRHPLLKSEDYRGYAQYGALHENGGPYRPEEYPMARSLIAKETIKGEEMKYRRGDGTETVFSVDAGPIYDAAGRMVMSVVTFIDIAARKEAENALRESEERFAKAFQASPDAMVISRVADGFTLEINDSFVSLSGYDRDELMAKSPLLLGLYVDPTDRQRAVTMLKERNFVRDLEIRMKRKSGEVRLILFSAQPLDLRGEHCWLTIGRDITERKRAEEERERLLLQEKAAREEAEAANRMKDEFLATVSHELRTPLTAIMGWARMLTDGSLSESQTQHALHVIEQSAKSQARLVADILDTSRMITGRFKLDAQPVEIARVFQAAIDVIRPTADAKGLALHAVIDDPYSIVRGDANRLQQVIWNLLSNAVKFTSKGGYVEARLTRSGSQVEISVADSGIGIEPSFMPYIFDRFRQADSTSTRKYGGLGLGLAIVRHIVEMHGGGISVSSPGKGRGTTFKVVFPAASSGRLPQQSESPPESKLKSPIESTRQDEPKTLAGVRVLVVEDDPDTLDMLSFILAESGADVVTAPSASEALKAFERSQPHVLVSDLAMPDQDGFQLIVKVRSRDSEHGGKVPAVALSSYTRAEDRMHALAAGFQVHVAKPVDPERLVAVVASLTVLARS